jgi:hypothetical protein
MSSVGPNLQGKYNIYVFQRTDEILAVTYSGEAQMSNKGQLRGSDRMGGIVGGRFWQRCLLGW